MTWTAALATQASVLGDRHGWAATVSTCKRQLEMCFGQVARSMGIYVPQNPDVAAGISLTYAEYLEAIVGLREMDFTIGRDPAEAWPHLVGRLVNYERAAYAIAAAVDAVLALCSGPRRRETEPIPPRRPMPGEPEPAPVGLCRPGRALPGRHAQQVGAGAIRAIADAAQMAFAPRRTRWPV